MQTWAVFGISKKIEIIIQIIALVGAIVALVGATRFEIHSRHSDLISILHFDGETFTEHLVRHRDLVILP